MIFTSVLRAFLLNILDATKKKKIKYGKTFKILKEKIVVCNFSDCLFFRGQSKYFHV